MTGNIAAAFKRQAKRLVAIAILASTIVAFHLANIPHKIDFSLVKYPYAFARHSLPEVPGPERRSFRPMHPDLHHVTAFMSTLGSGAALADLDGDGLPNDVCYVDTVTDQVIIAPAPGTGDRYKPFALDANLGGKTLYTRTTMGPMGCLPADVNADGRIDALVYYAGRTPLLFLSRPVQPDDRPSVANFIPIDVIPTGDIWVTGSATWADLDGSGHLYLILANYFADGSDILNPQGTGKVYLPNSLSTADNGAGVRIFKCMPQISGGERGAGCSEVRDALPPSLFKGWGLAVGTQDLDGDLYPEIYVANDFGPDLLLWNRSTPGHLRFEVVKGPLTLERNQNALGRDSFKGMGVDFADLNGDGIPDIGVSSISRHELMESHQMFLSTGNLDAYKRGVAPYDEHGEELGLMWSGWAWDIKFADFNNKGWPDVVQATGFLKGKVSRWAEIQEISIANDLVVRKAKLSWPWLMPGDDVSGDDKNPFYVRTDPKGRFVNIAKEIGFGEDQVSRGIAIADVDGNGKLSMIVSNMWGLSTFYHNQCSPCGNALELSVRLPASSSATDALTVVKHGYPDKSLNSRPAINAAVVVTTASGKRQIAQVDGGNGHSGKRSPDLHFGLGDEAGPAKVEVSWRTGDQVRHETFQLDPGWHTIILGSPPVTGMLEPRTSTASAQ
jgi:hypothetical protein